MTTKLDTIGIRIDWDAVNQATEIPRTYLIRDPDTGREFFKMYKPSEAKRIFSAQGWHGKIVKTMVGQ